MHCQIRSMCIVCSKFADSDCYNLFLFYKDINKSSVKRKYPVTINNKIPSLPSRETRSLQTLLSGTTASWCTVARREGCALTTKDMNMVKTFCMPDHMTLTSLHKPLAIPAKRWQALCRNWRNSSPVQYVLKATTKLKHMSIITMVSQSKVRRSVVIIATTLT